MKKNLVALCSRIAENSNRLIIEQLEKNGIKGIVPSHGGILHLLYLNKKVTMKEIADHVHKTKPTVTILVKKLEKLGFLYREKSEIDSRVTYIKLTKEGIELEPVFEKVSNLLNETVFKDLDEVECDLVEKTLIKMLNNFN